MSKKTYEEYLNEACKADGLVLLDAISNMSNKICEHNGMELQMIRLLGATGKLAMCITECLFDRTGKDIESKYLPENVIDAMADVSLLIQQINSAVESPSNSLAREYAKLKIQIDEIEAKEKR